MGPILFSIYINNLYSLVLPQGKIISYVDDTALIFTADTWSAVFAAAQNGFDIVNEWLQNIPLL